tara:strand:- start:819 stop:1025 length:207 start_codon:yes stop_codon:yes gene_type:complete
MLSKIIKYLEKLFTKRRYELDEYDDDLWEWTEEESEVTEPIYREGLRGGLPNNVIYAIDRFKKGKKQC